MPDSSPTSPARTPSELFYPNKADRPWRYIVLHHSASAAGNYDEIDREHRKLLGYEGCGYHFVIGNGNGSGDGQIEVARAGISRSRASIAATPAATTSTSTASASASSATSISSRPRPGRSPPPQALVAYLSRRYRIEPDQVTTHAHLAATPTVCPGKFFPATILAGARVGGPDAS